MVTLIFDPVTTKSIALLCYPRWMCGPCFKVGQGVLKLLIANGLDTFDCRDLDLWPSDSITNRVPLLPSSDVWWTKFEEGRWRRSPVIDQKRKDYRQTDRHMHSTMPSLLQRGVITIIYKCAYNSLLIYIKVTYNKLEVCLWLCGLYIWCGRRFSTDCNFYLSFLHLLRSYHLTYKPEKYKLL